MFDLTSFVPFIFCSIPALIIFFLLTNLFQKIRELKVVYHKYNAALEALRIVDSIATDKDYCDSYKLREDLERALNDFRSRAFEEEGCVSEDD